MSLPRLTNELATNWPLPDKYLVELGRVSALWASLESLLNLCVGKLAGFDNINDPTPFILLTHASFPQRLHMLSTLCEQLSPHAPNLGDYSTVISKLEAAQKKRNRFMHNGISHQPETNQFVLASGSARGKLKTSVDPVTPEDIRIAAEEVHLAMLALYKLVLQVSLKPRWAKDGT